MKRIISIFFLILLPILALAQTSPIGPFPRFDGTNNWTGQNIFHSTGMQDSPLIAWSQSGASAGLFQQDAHFDNEVLRATRSGMTGDTAYAPVLSVETGRESYGMVPVFRAWGCASLSGDNGFMTYQDGFACATQGFLDRVKLRGGTLSVDTANRQLVRADGSHLDWGSTGQPTSLLTQGNADARYALLGSGGSQRVLVKRASFTFQSNSAQWLEAGNWNTIGFNSFVGDAEIVSWGLGGMRPPAGHGFAIVYTDIDAQSTGVNFRVLTAVWENDSEGNPNSARLSDGMALGGISCSGVSAGGIGFAASNIAAVSSDGSSIFTARIWVGVACNLRAYENSGTRFILIWYPD